MPPREMYEWIEDANDMAKERDKPQQQKPKRKKR
jgi:hypothetical protein